VILVDSSVWIDFLRGNATPAVQRLIALLPKSQIGVGDLILCEVLRGVPTSRQAKEIELLMRGFEFVPLCGPEIAVIAAANHRRLRSLGITIRGAIDLIIGTYCIENDIPLLHADRDFEPLERHLGLRTA
jgi:predicted nucleic acid-binding protein